MKISASKKQLAKIISENGGWHEEATWAAQDRVVAMFSGGKPRYHSDCSEWASNADNGCCVWVIRGFAKLPQWHQTALHRDEYFHLYPAPDAWHAETEYPDCVKPTDPAKVDGDSKPTIEQLAADYRAKLEIAQKSQEETDSHHCGAKAALEKLVAAGKELGLVLSIADSAPVITKFTGKFYSQKCGTQPDDLDAICDGCGKRFGYHVGFSCRP